MTAGRPRRSREIVVDRLAGLLVGFCHGEEVAGGLTSPGRASRAMFDAVEHLRRGDRHLERPWLGAEEPRDLALAMAVPVAAKILPRALDDFDLVNAGWLDHLVGMVVDHAVDARDLGIARSVVHNIATRLLGSLVDGFDPRTSAFPPQPPAVVEIHHALMHSLVLDVDAAPGSVLRTTVDAFDLVRRHPSPEDACNAAASTRPTVAALALGLLGATHGLAVLPPPASDAELMAIGLAHVLDGAGTDMDDLARNPSTGPRPALS